MKFVFHIRRLEELDFFNLLIETARIYDGSLETEHILIILMRDKYQEQKELFKLRKNARGKEKKKKDNKMSD